MMRQIKTYLLTMLMSMVGIVVSAHDIEVKNSDGVTIYYVWTNDQTELAVSYGDYYYYSSKYFGNVVIPESVIYNGTSYSVTSIGKYAFYRCRGLTSVTIPNSVTSIGEYAFEGCTGLTSVTIGSGVTSIDNYAFKGCTGLTSVTIPNSVTSIGYSAFEGCTGLTSVTIGSGVTSIGNYAFEGCTGLTSVTIPNSVTSIGYSAFSGCIGLTSVTIPNNVTSINDNTFHGCIGLTSVTIGSGVTSIGKYAFEGCTGLTSVTIPNSVTSIGYSAFSGCTVLTSVTIGSGVTSIGNYAFDGCTGLTSVTLNSNAIVSKTYSSYSNLKNDFGSQVKEYIIGEAVNAIGDYAFYGCSSMTSLTIGNNVTSIGNDTFKDCKSIDNIKIHVFDLASFCNKEFVKIINTSIGKPFQLQLIGIDGNEIKAYVIPEGVTNICEQCFSNCTSLTSITFPESITTVGLSAFEGCTSLKSVSISDLTSWCTISFKNETANPLYYAHHLYLDGNEIINLSIPEGLTRIKSGTFYGCSGLISVKIPNSVTIIGRSAFELCDGLTSVEIPESVTSIYPYAFSGCTSLSSVNIPQSVTSIYWGAFQNCSALTSVTIPICVTSIDGYVFNGCTSLTSVTIPEGVTSISSSAFSECTGLTSVTIPNSVTSISSSAFKGCTGLTSVHISSLASWCGISFYDYSSNPLYYANHLFLNDEEIKELVIPDSVTSIGNYAFRGCTGLTSVTIPESVTSIGISVFSGCTGLTSATIGKNVKSIGNDAFKYCTGLTSVAISSNEIVSNTDSSSSNMKNHFGSQVKEYVVGEGVKKIGDYAFYGCSGMTTITIPNSVTSIGSNAFNGCTGLIAVHISNLASWCAVSFNGYSSNPLNYAHHLFMNDEEIIDLVIPEGVTKIGTLFSYCTGITSVTIPNSVTSIGESAFANCTELKSITIGRKVESIGYSAFSKCKKVERVICLLDRLFTINTNVFAEEAYINAQLLVPLGQKSKYKSVSAWSKFLTVEERDFLSTHKLTYLVDGTVYKQYELGYDEVITPEGEPEKEGHTFSGWSEIPNRMPPNDVNVTGMFSVNQYQVTFVVDGKVVATMMVDYGKTITPPDVPNMDGYNFVWTDLPETMPAEDITVHGAYSEFSSGVDSIISSKQKSSIYDINGRRILNLQRGVNIILMSDGTTRKVVIK